MAVACAGCGKEVRRVPEVGDAWLDAGIVPLATLGWENPEFVPEGYATGAGKGLTTADLPDHAYWEQWFPANWVSEMREQIRLWFYSISFMSVTLTGRSPYERVLTYEKLLDETGREMHRSWGNAIAVDDAFDRMGADVMRWQYSAQPPNQNLLFGFGPAHEIKRRLLTLWNSAKFLTDYANIAGWQPVWDDLAAGPGGELQPLDRWLVARTNAFVEEATEAYESWLTVNVVRGFDEFVEDVSNWYIRRSRRRFWDGDEVAFRALWYALVQAVRVVAPGHAVPGRPSVARADRALRGGARVGLPRRLAGGRRSRTRRSSPRSRSYAASSSSVGRHARLRASDCASRSELWSWRARRWRRATRTSFVEELRVKEVVFGIGRGERAPREAEPPPARAEARRRAGLGAQALEAGDFEELAGGGFRAAGHDLSADEVLVERRGKEGWSVAASDGVTVALDSRLDDELRREGRVYDLIHRVNSMRKEAGLELTDRIALTLPETDRDLLEHPDWIARETLAVSVESAGLGAGDRQGVVGARLASPSSFSGHRFGRILRTWRTVARAGARRTRSSASARGVRRLSGGSWSSSFAASTPIPCERFASRATCPRSSFASASGTRLARFVPRSLSTKTRLPGLRSS